MNEEKRHVCRVCLSTSKRKYVSIFKRYKDCFVFDHINSITNLRIWKGDGLPDEICRRCLSDLDTAIIFKQKCEGSNSILLSSYTNASTTGDNTDLKDVKVKKEEPLELPDDNEFIEESYVDSCDTFADEVDVKQDVDVKQETANSEVEKVQRKSRAVDAHLQCDDCKDFFKSKCKLRVHWKNVHLPQKLICPECKRRFKSVLAYNNHKANKRKSCQEAKHIRIEGEGRNRTFYCKDCEYKSVRIKDIMTHRVIHTGDRPFQCDICHQSYTQQSALMAHKESAHKVFKVEMTCHYCGKYVKGRNRIYRHLRTHTDKSVECTVCNKIFKSKIYLQQHMRRHSGTKSYTCEKCARSFYTIADLCNHKRTIHNKPNIWYKCDLCDYKSLRKPTVKRHTSKHTDSNIPCTVCGMFLENAQKLIIHQRRHFDEKKFACPICDMKFLRRDTVPKHIRAKHGVFYSSQQTQQTSGLQVESISLTIKEEKHEKQYQEIRSANCVKNETN